MLRKFLFLLLFVLASQFSLAVEKIDLSEHGKDLMKAPFAARYHFYNRYHKDWINSSYTERRDFLTYWHRNQNELNAKQALESKEEARMFKEKSEQKKEEFRIQKERMKQAKDQQKEEEKTLLEQKKEFKNKVKGVQATIKDMKQAQKH